MTSKQRLNLACALSLTLLSCAAEVSDTVEATSVDTDQLAGEAMADDGAAGSAAQADALVDVLVDKEAGSWATTVEWSLKIKTGCVANASTDAVVRAKKKQYSFWDRDKKQYWVDRTYTLDRPNYNDNQQCTTSLFDQSVLKSYTDSSAVVTRLRLWHDNGGNAPGWYVEYAYLSWNGSGSAASFRCDFNRWIYKDEVAEAACYEWYWK